MEDVDDDTAPVPYFSPTPPPPFAKGSHIKYFRACLTSLPEPYSSLDTNRLTVAYFCIAGLDLLGAVDQLDKPSLIKWIYSQQLRRGERDGDDWLGGFRGSFLICAPFDPKGAPSSNQYDVGHLAMTYTALATLSILGDDLSGVDRAAVLRHVHSLQQPDGSFCAVDGGENDMRFVYCAAAICAFLKDGGGAGEDLGEEGSSDEWEGMDASSAAAYILASQSYDGALGLGPGAESHGGSTYTGLAALSLMGKLPQLRRQEAAIRWCVDRQLGGFQGRPNKDEDTCYSFWIGASLALLGAGGLSSAEALGCFARCCQYKRGGLSKTPGAHPDVLHSYFACAGLAVAGHAELAPLDARFGISLRARDAAGLRAPPGEQACEPCID